jgi:hypothetical protein
MSAVSPESRRTSASTSGPAGAQRADAQPGSSGEAGEDSLDQRGLTASATDFGPNELLVDELYQRYLNDPDSVDRAWWNFFAGHSQEECSIN